MPTVVKKTTEELKQQRERLLAQAGMSEEELRDRAERYELSPDQLDALTEIDNIKFLLGE